jgi:predicted transcriptional regulator
LIKAGRGCKKTHIMYGANLSTIQLKRYLEILVRIGCIDYDDKNRLYKTTQKGINLLEAISEVSRAKTELHISKKRLESIMGEEQEHEEDINVDYSPVPEKSNKKSKPIQWIF